MDLLLFWVVISGSYGALVWGLAYVLPERAYPLLRRLHGFTLGLCLLIASIPLLTRGDWTLKSWGLFGLLLLLSGLLAGIRGRLNRTHSSPLSTLQSVLVGIAAPLLLVFGPGPSADLAYTDGDYTVTINTHPSLQRDDLLYTDVELYRTHGLVLQESVGHIVLDQTGTSVPERMAWWRDVSSLSFDAKKNHGVARHGGRNVPFEVNPPLHGSGAPKSVQLVQPPSGPALPVTDDKVYAFVEEMPQMPGHYGSVSAAIEQAIQARLVRPRDVQEGRVFVSLEVDKAGNVRNLHLAKGLNASTNAAVLAAASQLPRLLPGRDSGQIKNVSLIIPILVDIPKARRDKQGRQ